MWKLPTRGLLFSFSALIASLFLNSTLHSCQVPVFRYALERWSSEKYQVQILSQGTIGLEPTEWLESLESKSELLTAVELQRVDVSTSKDAELLQIWEKHVSDEERSSSSLLVVRYPGRFNSAIPAAIEKLTESSLPALLDSPVRQEIVKRLTAGHSAVWVLLKSGDATKDAVALQTLQAQLSHDAEHLQLPSAEELEVDDSILGKAKIPLQIKFSVVELDRSDTAERFFIESLLRSEEDLREYDNEPIAFPVFGRGIVLYALVGAGISPDVVGAASKFIVGPCSCQVKEQNPGFDLLLNCDWDGIVGNTLISSPVPTSDSPPRLLTIPPGKTKK